MFDLEQAIGEWRKEMLTAGIQSPVPLDELENHLREDIEQQVRAGADEAQAFEAGVRNVGQAVTLKKEFMKANNLMTAVLRRIKSFILDVRKAPLPSLENFEPLARHTLELAPEEARHFNHTFVGTEHLLLGLIRSGSKTVSKVMQECGVNGETVRREIERVVGTSPVAVDAAQIPLTPRARQALQLATEEAGKLNQARVKPEHIFLGLLREGGGVAALVLRNLGVQLEMARAEVLKEMNAHPEAG